MSLSKLKQIHIIIIGAFLCIAAGAGLFFLMIKPQQEALKAATARRDTASQVGNASSEQQAIKELNEAVLKVSQVQQNLDAQMRRRMPNLSFARRDTGMLSLWREYTGVMGPLFEGFAKDKNINLLNASFTVPSPPVNPNDAAFDQDLLVIPLGSVQVSGDFKGVMDNVRRWNNCRRLVMLSPPTLAGQSPNLICSYSLTCYIFPVAKGGPQIQMAGAAGGQGGQGGAGATLPAGMPMGPMGGMPGGPPMPPMPGGPPMPPMPGGMPQ
jgi:hypothetical protein